jgi:hypothetical protein
MHPPPLFIPPAERPPQSLTVARHDAQWERPIFRAPALTAWPQLAQRLPVAPLFPAKPFSASTRVA